MRIIYSRSDGMSTMIKEFNYLPQIQIIELCGRPVGHQLQCFHRSVTSTTRNRKKGSFNVYDNLRNLPAVHLRYPRRNTFLFPIVLPVIFELSLQFFKVEISFDFGHIDFSFRNAFYNSPFIYKSKLTFSNLFY
jgi:hypothetical protein